MRICCVTWFIQQALSANTYRQNLCNIPKRNLLLSSCRDTVAKGTSLVLDLTTALWSFVNSTQNRCLGRPLILLPGLFAGKLDGIARRSSTIHVLPLLQWADQAEIDSAIIEVVMLEYVEYLSIGTNSDIMTILMAYIPHPLIRWKARNTILILSTLCRPNI